MNIFEVRGPLMLATRMEGGRRRLGTEAERKAFWGSTIQTNWLRKRRGVWVFGLRVGGLLLPCYVGRTGRQMFGTACLSTARVARYEKALAAKGGEPFLFFVFPKAGTSDSGALKEIEAFLVQLAWRRVPDLGTFMGKAAPAWSIPGVVPGGSYPDTDAAAFLGMVGLAR